MRFPRSQIENHLREVGVGPREPRSGIIGRIVGVLSFVDQTKPCGILPRMSAGHSPMNFI
jgi:hypothetical protein